MSLHIHKLVSLNRLREGIIPALDDIPGIGPKRKKALPKRFASIEAIKEAPLEEFS